MSGIPTTTPALVTREMNRVTPPFEFMRFQKGYWHNRPEINESGFHMGTYARVFHLVATSPTPFPTEAKPAQQL